MYAGGGGGGGKQKKIGKKKFQWTGNNFVFEDGLKTFLKIPFITTHPPFEKGLPRPLLYTISLRPKTLSERVCCLNAPRGVLYVNRPTNGSPKWNYISFSFSLARSFLEKQYCDAVSQNYHFLETSCHTIWCLCRTLVRQCDHPWKRMA